MNYEQAIRTTIITLNNLIDYEINPAYQSNKVGRLDTGIYWHALSPIDRGFQSRSYDIQGSNANHKELQIIEQPIQVSCYVSDPKSERLTAFDIANTARSIINSLTFVELMQSHSIQPTRCTELRAMKFVNEHDNYEDEVSFQFSILFKHYFNPPTKATNKKVVDNLV